ncbi:ribosome assembly cofactor RimP [Mycoplasmopsis opalescens]|uniref:ribosome assembly cofactor RimP n=1 Tax=Mycoplasmopsis opalescens TaxID=114886 RepID=UPI0004A77390|nr:ribosome assembly cofactor RimP [Mycoplasmopsis opalescens]
MNWKEIFSKCELSKEILDAKIVKEDGMNLLEITVNKHDLEQIELISQKINFYFDSLDKNITDQIDSLTILSPGVSSDIQFEELSGYIGKNLFIKLKKSENKTMEYIAVLLEVNNDNILIKWNSKGNIRKIQVSKENIKQIEEYIKF